MRSIDVALSVQSSRPFPPNISEIGFDAYKIKPVLSDSGKEGTLEFKDEWVQGQIASHPEQEAKLVLSWLSVALRSRLRVEAVKLNNVLVPHDRLHEQFLRPLESSPELQVLFDKTCALPDDLFRIYLRACDLYQLAILVIDDRPSLAIFLLVSSIECLANIVASGNGFKQRFLNFIKDFCPTSVLGSNKRGMPVDDLLSKVYQYRSQYTHGGKEVTLAASVADQLRLDYVKHSEGGKEELAPSVNWFESVVSASLLGFLKRTPAGSHSAGKRKRFADLALSFGIVYFKVKHSVVAGQLLTRNDYELR